MGNSPSTPLTENDLQDQSGKVFIVTGASSGVGKLLAGILYGANAKVYVAARNASKASAAIAAMKAQHPESKGSLIFLNLDLNDLTTIKASADEFLSKEKRLDVLWNNAGVMIPPQGSKTKQGYELQLGTNCIAPFLFTKLLLPLLRQTAAQTPPNSVRIVWVSSSAAAKLSPKGGVELDNLTYATDRSAWQKYGTSKAGNIFHGAEFARRCKEDGIVNSALDPGNLKTDLYQHVPRWQQPIVNLVLKDPILGAYTELYAGLSPDVTLENTGAWINPGGHIAPHTRKDILEACKRKADGGSGTAELFYEWTEEQIRPYL